MWLSTLQGSPVSTRQVQAAYPMVAVARRRVTMHPWSCREGFGKSPLEKLHSRAMRRTVSHGPGPARAHATPVRSASLSAAAEAVYLRHMHELIDEYLDETVLTGLAPGA